MKELIKLFVFIILSLISILSFAQSALEHAEDRSMKNEKKQSEIPIDQLEIEQCAFEEVNLRESSLPGSKSLAEREVEFDAYVKEKGQFRLDGEVKTIPVVVHIVHLGEAVGVGNNISEAQVLSAMTQLNDRYRKTPGTHGDADGVDTEIEFCLASIDPDGNPTNGIVRVDGSDVTGYEEGGICVISSQCTLNELSVKNLSRWPNNEYYNIWVVSEIQGNNGSFGIQGFAYFPGASSLYDGTVIMNTCFGGIGTVNSWNDMGRTLVHEMGHGMGLYHSFEGDNGGSMCPSGNGDYVSDTDPHKRSSSNCPSGTNTCTGNPSSDVVHNYMDYSSQSCADMFFLGQADRMHAQIDFWRSSLVSSGTCQLEGVTDLALTNVVNNQDYQCASSYAPIVSALNMGSDTISSIEFTYSYDGGATNNYTYNSVLYPGDSVQITLPSQVLTYAAHSLSISGSPDQTDANLDNNDLAISFETLNQDPYSLEIVLDNAGSENSWEVLNDNLDVVAHGGPYQDGQNGITINEDVCFPVGCNQFIFFESYGDGMGSGSYTLSDDQGNEIANGWNSGSASNLPTAMFESTSIEGPTTTVSASETSICMGESVTLTASGGDSYSWSNGQSGSSISVSPNVTTTYSVTSSLNACSGNEVMITITVLPSPTATITPNNPEVCAGESITLTASGGATYTWSTGETGSSIVVSPEDNMNISVVPNNGCVGVSTSVNIDVTQLPVTTVDENQFTICEGSSVTLIADGGETYLWNTGASDAEMVVAPNSETTYTVTAYNGACPGNTEEIIVYVNEAPFAGPSSEVTFCSSEDSQDLFSYLVAADEGGQWYDPNGNAIDGIFNASSDDGGDYLYVLNGSGSCEDVSTVLTVYVDQQPNSGTSTSISVNVNSSNVNLIDFLAGADEGGMWSDPNGDDFDGSFDPSIDPEGMYVYAFDPDPPCNSNSAIVSVSITGSSNAGSDASVFFCDGDNESSLFPLLMGADAGGTWLDPNGNEFNGILDPQSDESGDYVYSIGDSEAVVTVTISETPVPEVFTTTDHYEIYTDILFENTGSAAGNVSWDFGDGSSSSDFNPIHQYAVEGFYNVILTVEENGCVGSDEHGLIITDIASGITENYIEENLVIYPNPGFGMFKLRFDLGEEHEVKYDVLNSNGKLIATSGKEMAINKVYTINLMAQSTGYYFLRFYVDDLVVTKKLLKTN